MIELAKRLNLSGLELNGVAQTSDPFRTSAEGFHDQGMLAFAQMMAYLHLSPFRRCVAVHRGDFKTQGFCCVNQYFAKAFAQLT